MLPDIFWEIHSGLPREGPGDNASTRRAFEMAAGLPANPRILDIGCGPGMQTLELATISRGFVAALDLHRPFLSNVMDRASAAGLTGQIATVNASMVRLPFEDASFDLIWCEGAMYFMGFREALAAWKGVFGRAAISPSRSHAGSNPSCRKRSKISSRNTLR